MELTDIKILIADEDEKFRLTLKSIFLDRNIRVEEAKDGFETVKLIEDYRPDIILLALKLTGIGGIEILKKVQPLVSDSIVIIITAHGSIRTAIEATRLGIYDYIEKPIKPERILAMIDQALHAKALESENIRLKDALISEYKLIGKSEVVQNIVSFVNKAAISDANVLLTGNNGTGKDHLAQYIHLNSSRNQHQFVNVNCAAIPAHLMESELFGFEKGAFTGAYKTTIGKFEQANNGTILLNEIAELNTEMQAKLLHVLESKTVERLGSDEAIKINVRVIAATNIKLDMAIRKGLFRQDLFYRLNVLQINLPDLKDRPEDIIPLFEYFMERICERQGLITKTLMPDALSILYSYSWPGNIRQLKNVATNLTIMVNRSHITGDDIQRIIEKESEPNRINQPVIDHSLFKARDNFECNYILRHLEENNWNVLRTAEILKIDRSYLYALMQKHKIVRDKRKRN
jgi:two-component system nitrogen regulation response regulator NtrX